MNSSKKPVIEVVRSEKKHLEALIQLFIAEYTATREQLKLLPARYASEQVIRPYLSWMLNECTGVVALIEGEVVGFMSALFVDPFKSAFKGAYSPEFTHAAITTNRIRIYDAMRARLWQMLASVGCASHCISLLEGDAQLKNDHYLSGYGTLVLDGIATTQALKASTASEDEALYRARVAISNDAEALKKLIVAHEAYMAEAPVFFHSEDVPVEEKLENWFMDELRVTWVIECVATGALAGYANFVKDAENTCYILRDPEIIGIQGMYVDAQHRGKGAGQTLLNEAAHWAERKGYQSVAINFESANHLAKHFWLKHFQIVSQALIRHIDTRVLKEKTL